MMITEEMTTFDLMALTYFSSDKLFIIVVHVRYAYNIHFALNVGMLYECIFILPQFVKCVWLKPA